MPILSEYQTRIPDRRARLEFIAHSISHHFINYSKIWNESFFSENHLLLDESFERNESILNILGWKFLEIFEILNFGELK